MIKYHLKTRGRQLRTLIVRACAPILLKIKKRRFPIGCQVYKKQRQVIYRSDKGLYDSTIYRVTGWVEEKFLSPLAVHKIHKIEVIDEKLNLERWFHWQEPLKKV